MASILSSLIDFFPRFHTTWNIKHWQSRRSYCHCSQMWVSSGLPLQSRGSNDSPESNTSDGGGVSHSHSEAMGEYEPRRWQGTAGPLRKQSQVRGVPAGEGEWEGMGLVARGNQLLSNQLPLCKLWAYWGGRDLSA